MKTVKSREDLERLALSRGASASIGASRFNTTATKVDAVQATEPQAKAPPAAKESTPAPAATPQVAQEIKVEVPGLAEVVTAMGAGMDRMARDNAMVMDEVRKAMERISAMPTEAPQADNTTAQEYSWRLKVHRDTRGFMDTVDITRSC